MLCDNTEGCGMGWEVAGRFKRKGTYVCLWLIHVDVWQKPTQFCKAIILQLKGKKNPKTVKYLCHPVGSGEGAGEVRSGTNSMRPI